MLWHNTTNRQNTIAYDLPKVPLPLLNKLIDKTVLI